jgi:hypothetical protein
MGSTVCVSCGATLIPYSYCEVCQDILRFRYSSCSMFTDERVHTYCHNTNFQDNNNVLKLVQISNPSQIVLDDYIQNQLNDEMKYSSIKLFTSYWDNLFESVKLVNTYWLRIFNIGNSSSSSIT